MVESVLVMLSPAFCDCNTATTQMPCTDTLGYFHLRSPSRSSGINGKMSTGFGIPQECTNFWWKLHIGITGPLVIALLLYVSVLVLPSDE